MNFSEKSVINGNRAVLTRQTFLNAARIRAQQSTSRISLADAIHLASANIVQCHSFLTNDRRLLRQKSDNLNTVDLSDKSPGSGSQGLNGGYYQKVIWNGKAKINGVPFCR